MRVLIAPDSFKGTLRAAEAADAILQGIGKALPGALFTSIPLADGGEGTLDAVRPFIKAVEHSTAVHTLSGSNIIAPWLAIEGSAIIESAMVLGHGLVREPFRDPFKYHSGGLGELLNSVSNQGLSHLYVALGGSGTQDCGLGMAYVLGYRFYDALGNEVKPSYGGSIIEALGAVRRVRVSDLAFKCTVLADVQNPLTGPEGAARTYARQKGFTADQLSELDDATASFADVVTADVVDVQYETPGMGAAGGLGFGLAAFCGADIVTGIDWVMERTGFVDACSDADLVVTGEGRYDGQTCYGKVVSRVSSIARRQGKEVLIVAGQVGVDLQVADEHTHIIQSSPDGREPSGKAEAFSQVVQAVETWCRAHYGNVKS